MLEAINLRKIYGAHEALQGLNLKVNAGDIYCLLGANGAGKTTTINLFLNFVDPTSGTATVNGIDVTQNPLETKRYLAYIPEQVMLYGNLTGFENLEYFARLGGHAGYSAADYRSFLDRVGLQPNVEPSGTYLFEGHAPESRRGDRARQAGESATPRRANFRS